MPIADKYRPIEIEDVVGQSHIIGEGKMINNMLEKKYYPNMIFFGPPGIGKTTIARIISKNANMRFFKINATNSSLEDIKKVIAEIGKIESKDGILLYIDEIQSFNKKQQQSILEFMENGDITLIASTTENPYYYIYKAILSRSIVVELMPMNTEEITSGIYKILSRINDDSLTKIKIEDEVVNKIAGYSSGDLRSAINMLEMCINQSNIDKDGLINITSKVFDSLNFTSTYNFDRDGDVHYDLLSAFQKSIRGSDADAAVHYLARLIKGGDLISICRRLLVISSEDIGLAYPSAISIVKNCVDSAMQLGLPEARILLSQATILLATSPKSNSVYLAIDSALNDIDKGIYGDIPNYLKDAHYSGASEIGRGNGYLYPHNFKNNFVEQEYLPSELKGKKYYLPQDNKYENGIKSFIERLTSK